MVVMVTVVMVIYPYCNRLQIVAHFVTKWPQGVSHDNYQSLLMCLRLVLSQNKRLVAILNAYVAMVYVTMVYVTMVLGLSCIQPCLELYQYWQTLIT